MSDAPARWRTALRWAERAVWLALVVFVLRRLSPQLGALVGVSVGEGSTPAWTLQTLDGDPVGADRLAGRVVVVNFWATWCPPCRVEMPSLQRAWEAHEDDGLTVVGVNVDVGGEAAIQNFLSERGITFPVGRATVDIQRAFGGISGLPTTLVLDRAGTVRHRVVGYFAPPALNQAIDRLLAEPAPAPAGPRAYTAEEPPATAEAPPVAAAPPPLTEPAGATE